AFRRLICWKRGRLKPFGPSGSDSHARRLVGPVADFRRAIDPTFVRFVAKFYRPGPVLEGRPMHSLRLLRRRRDTIRVAAISASLASLSGCQATQVANRTVNQSSYIADMQYRQVIDNLAILADNPSAMPYFNPPNASKTTIQRTAGTTFGMQWGLIAAVQSLVNRGATAASFPALALTRMHEPLIVNQLAPGFQGTQQNIEEWDTNLLLDPIPAI